MGRSLSTAGLAALGVSVSGAAVPETLRAASGATPAQGMDAWVKIWLADKTARGQTCMKENESHYRMYVGPVMGGRHIATWTQDDLRALSRSLDEKVQAGTIRKEKTATNIWGTASKMCADAMRSKIDALRCRVDNPSLGIAPPERGVKTAKQYLHPDELLQFVSCEDVPLTWRRMVALLVYLYPRPGELRELRWEDVNLSRKVVHFHQATSRVTGGAKETKGACRSSRR